MPQACMPNYAPGYPKCGRCNTQRGQLPTILNTKELYYKGSLCESCEKELKTSTRSRLIFISNLKAIQEETRRCLKDVLSGAITVWEKRYSPMEVERRIEKCKKVLGWED